MLEVDGGLSAFPDDEDGAVLAALAEAGIDLSVPIALEFVIDAPDEAAAAAIAVAARKAGYECHVAYDKGEDYVDGVEGFIPSWVVYVTVEEVAEHGRVVALQRTFAQLADPYGGTCDGWGALA